MALLHQWQQDQMDEVAKAAGNDQAVDSQGTDEEPGGDAVPMPDGALKKPEAQEVQMGKHAAGRDLQGPVIYAGPVLGPSGRQRGNESQTWYGKPE
eukprot:3978690-Heterocapsa_arctica.AAC.1